jgi:hypothetical protein
VGDVLKMIQLNGDFANGFTRLREKRKNLTLELRRCRASKVTYKSKPTPLAQIVSKTAAVGSRLERFVGRAFRADFNILS